MSCWHYLSFECINDELERLGLDTLNTFLYNMVSILIFHTFQNMAIQLFHHFILEKNPIIHVFTTIPTTTTTTSKEYAISS